MLRCFFLDAFRTLSDVTMWPLGCRVAGLSEPSSVFCFSQGCRKECLHVWFANSDAQSTLHNLRRGLWQSPAGLDRSPDTPLPSVSWSSCHLIIILDEYFHHVPFNWTRANFLLLQKMYHKLHYAFSIFSLYLIYRLSLSPPPLCFLFHFHSSLPLPHFSASHWPVSVLWVKDCPSGLEPALGLCDFSSQSLISASRQLMFGEHSPPQGKCYLWCVIPLVLTLTKC